MRNAGQKLPVCMSTVQASTVPIMKKSPCAILMMSSRPKMIDRPSAISAMIKPQMRPLIARTRTTSSNCVSPAGGCALAHTTLESYECSRAGPLLNVGVAALAIVALPVYFVRSRGWKRGGIICLYALGAVGVLYLLETLGEFIGEAIAGMGGGFT